MSFDDETIIGDILDEHPTCECVFRSFDMPCTDCPSSRGETLAEACDIHGVELQILLQALQMHLDG